MPTLKIALSVAPTAVLLIITAVVSTSVVVVTPKVFTPTRLVVVVPMPTTTVSSWVTLVRVIGSPTAILSVVLIPA